MGIINRVKSSIRLINGMSGIVFYDAASRQAFLDKVAENWNVKPELKPEYKEEQNKQEEIKKEEIKEEENKQDENKQDENKQDENKQDENKQDEGQEEIIKIGNKEFTTEEFSEITKKAEEHYGEDLTDLPEKILEKIILDYVNITAASKSVSNRNQELAREKKELENDKSQIQKEQEQIALEKERLEAEKKVIQDKIEYNKKLLETDLDDIDDSRERRKIEIDQSLAERENANLELKMKSLQGEIQKVDNDFVVAYIGGLVEMLQAENPELMTKDHVFDILTDMKDGKIEPSDPECFKATIITEIINDYNQNINKSGKEKFTVSQYYQSIKPKYAHALEKAQTSLKKKTYVEFKAENAKDVIRKLLKKQKTNTETSSRSADLTAGGGSENSSREAIAKRITDRFNS